MKRSHAFALTAGLLLLAAPGCATQRGAAPEAPAPRTQTELPPSQAAEACLATATTLDKHGYETEAIAEYEKARAQDPQLTQVSRRLAVLYDRQGDTSRALAEYQQALQASPHDAGLLNDVGYFHYSRDNLAEAEKWLRQALQINPGLQRAWVNLGLVLGKQQRYDESLEAFAHAVSPAEARANVGILLAKQGRTEEAKESLHQALALQPDLKQARVVLDVLEGASPAQTAATVTPAGGNISLEP